MLARGPDVVGPSRAGVDEADGAEAEGEERRGDAGTGEDEAESPAESGEGEANVCRVDAATLLDGGVATGSPNGVDANSIGLCVGCESLLCIGVGVSATEMKSWDEVFVGVEMLESAGGDEVVVDVVVVGAVLGDCGFGSVV